MTAYAIGNLTIHNTAWQQEYGEKIPALLKKHRGKLLARTIADNLEGNTPLTNTAIVIEFPNKKAALDWYNDPDYQQLTKLRQSGADLDLCLVDTLNI